MRDELPKTCNVNECGILNLETSESIGSHWVAYFKKGNYKCYFDSYGDAKPPKELVKYLGTDNLYYNTDRIQQYEDPPICGHLCLIILKYLSQGNDFQKTINICKNKKYYLINKWIAKLK